VIKLRKNRKHRFIFVDKGLGGALNTINPIYWAIIIREIIIKPVVLFIKVVWYLMQLPFKGLIYVWAMGCKYLKMSYKFSIGIGNFIYVHTKKMTRRKKTKIDNETQLK